MCKRTQPELTLTEFRIMCWLKSTLKLTYEKWEDYKHEWANLLGWEMFCVFLVNDNAGVYDHQNSVNYTDTQGLYIHCMKILPHEKMEYEKKPTFVTFKPMLKMWIEISLNVEMASEKPGKEFCTCCKRLYDKRFIHFGPSVFRQPICQHHHAVTSASFQTVLKYLAILW